MTRTSRRRRPRGPLAVVVLCVVTLLAVLGASGCAGQQAGAAAIVGDQRLSVSDLQQQVEDYAASLPNPPVLRSLAPDALAQYQRFIVQGWVQHQLFQRIAAERGIGVTPAQVDAQLRQLQASGEEAYRARLAQQGFTEQSVRSYVYDTLVAGRLGGEEQIRSALVTAGEQAGVWVSPRYGEWADGVVRPTEDGLSEPASPASPTSPPVEPTEPTPTQPAPETPAPAPEPVPAP